MKARKRRVEINLASVLVGVFLGTPLGTILATERISVVSLSLLVFGSLIVLSQFLIQFKDKDRLRKLNDMNEEIEN